MLRFEGLHPQKSPQSSRAAGLVRVEQLDPQRLSSLSRQRLLQLHSTFVRRGLLLGKAMNIATTQ